MVKDLSLSFLAPSRSQVVLRAQRESESTYQVSWRYVMPSLPNMSDSVLNATGFTRLYVRVSISERITFRGYALAVDARLKRSALVL